MGFDDSSLNYFSSSDHAKGIDLEILKKYFNRKFDCMLDVATAAGHLTKAFTVKTKVACDISFNMLKTARKHNKLKNVAQCDSECLPFRDRAFDLVGCRIALHHFKNPKLFFEEATRVLKPNGYLVVIDSIVDVDDAYLNGIEFIRDHTHIRSYSMEEVNGFSGKDLRLMKYNCLFKEHDFDEWAKRLSKDEETYKRITQEFANLPDHIQKELSVNMLGRKIISYTDKKGLFVFQRI